MIRKRLLLFWLIFLIIAPKLSAQSGESDINIFGYFQTEFRQTSFDEDALDLNSFNLQQLNIFFQKDISSQWSSFVNIEFLNSFSARRSIGDATLEEAWARYRKNEKFNVKAGLLIPTFNNLNVIKNRTPLLPYIIRPLVYETAFSSDVPIHEFIPERAFVQAYGFIPYGNVKFDYALYVGNSPNVTTSPFGGRNSQTGIDTTDTFLLGGRIGVRNNEIKAGISVTHDRVNEISTVRLATKDEQPTVTSVDLPNYVSVDLPVNEISRYRLGGDLSFNVRKFSFESEFIIVKYDDDDPEIDIDKYFYYIQLGYFVTEKFFIYGNHVVTNFSFAPGIEQKVKDPSVGVSYSVNDRIVLKGQYAPVQFDYSLPILDPTPEFDFFAGAISVYF